MSNALHFPTVPPVERKRIGAPLDKLKNAKQTPYAIVQAKISYPDGTEQIVDSRLYEASATANPGRFVQGANIDLRMQMEGEYEGRSVVQLPGAVKTDTSKLRMFKPEGSELKDAEVAAAL